MKKALALAFVFLLAVPGLLRSEVNAGAGNITLLGHIDFVGRYSPQDESEGWPGYETYNLEFAVLGMAGQVGDHVSWLITEAFTFVPAGSLASWAANSSVDSSGAVLNNNVAAQLLDAQISFHLGDRLTITAGRMIPPTSMTWNPHLVKVLHTINYPLLNLSGLQGGGLMQVPLPMYQTGVMLTGKFGPLTLQLGNYNGSDILGGVNLPGFIMPAGMSNIVDIDKTKGTSVKLSLDSNGLHCAGWYYGEEAAAKLRNPQTGAKVISDDAAIEQWGVEAEYNSERLVVQAQYLSTELNFNDPHANSPLGGTLNELYQSGWYVMGGVNLGPAQIVARYDYFDYDNKKVILSDRQDQEAATTLGVNYLMNENVTLSVNYTWRDIEDWGANPDELAVLAEVNLF